MTREHAKQLLPIIKAWSEGAEMEFKSSEIWGPMVSNPSFEHPPDCYRIKPQPREFWIAGSTWFPTKELADEWGKSYSVQQPIHVREVIP